MEGISMGSNPQSQWWSRWRHWKGERSHLKLSLSAPCRRLANPYLEKGLESFSCYLAGKKKTCYPQFSLPLAPTSTSSPGCQLILMLLSILTPPCCHGPALTCWSHSNSSPTQLLACSSLALPPLAGTTYTNSALWGSVVVSREKVTLLLWPSLCISAPYLTLCKTTLIAWESLINPNDFFHDFLLILNQLSCLLTCRMTNPLNKSIFFEELLRKLCKSQ